MKSCYFPSLFLTLFQRTMFKVMMTYWRKKKHRKKNIRKPQFQPLSIPKRSTTYISLLWWSFFSPKAPQFPPQKNKWTFTQVKSLPVLSCHSKKEISHIRIKKWSHDQGLYYVFRFSNTIFQIIHRVLYTITFSKKSLYTTIPLQQFT